MDWQEALTLHQPSRSHCSLRGWLMLRSTARLGALWSRDGTSTCCPGSGTTLSGLGLTSDAGRHADKHGVEQGPWLAEFRPDSWQVPVAAPAAPCGIRSGDQESPSRVESRVGGAGREGEAAAWEETRITSE